MTDSSFAAAMRCAERARDLARDLDKVQGPGDVAQMAAGLRHELNCVIQRLSDGLDALRADATGDRPGKERNDARATSRAAARVLLRPGSQRALVLDALYRWGDLTDHEIQTKLEMDPSSERPRRGELVDGGFVTPALKLPENGGGAITRKHKGREFQVWRITKTGVEAAAKLSRIAFDSERAKDITARPVTDQQLF